MNTYDFPSMAAGKAIPYGVYDIAEDKGFVSVGIDRDTAQFSVAAIQAWWEQLGQERSRLRAIRFPHRGISPQIEHRLFSFISKNWSGRPPVSYEVIINSIAATTIRTGLQVYARLDQHDYPTVEISDTELAAVNITCDAFHPEWNYSISPSTN